MGQLFLDLAAKQNESSKLTASYAPITDAIDSEYAQLRSKMTGLKTELDNFKAPLNSTRKAISNVRLTYCKLDAVELEYYVKEVVKIKEWSLKYKKIEYSVISYERTRDLTILMLRSKGASSALEEKPVEDARHPIPLVIPFEEGESITLGGKLVEDARHPIPLVIPFEEGESMTLGGKLVEDAQDLILDPTGLPLRSFLRQIDMLHGSIFIQRRRTIRIAIKTLLTKPIPTRAWEVLPARAWEIFDLLENLHDFIPFIKRRIDSYTMDSAEMKIQSSIPYLPSIFGKKKSLEYVYTTKNKIVTLGTTEKLDVGNITVHRLRAKIPALDTKLKKRVVFLCCLILIGPILFYWERKNLQALLKQCQDTINNTLSKLESKQKAIEKLLTDCKATLKPKDPTEIQLLLKKLFAEKERTQFKSIQSLGSHYIVSWWGGKGYDHSKRSQVLYSLCQELEQHIAKEPSNQSLEHFRPTSRIVKELTTAYAPRRVYKWQLENEDSQFFKDHLQQICALAAND